jgi:hypothetical protein
MTTNPAAVRLLTLANSYWRDADAMKRDPENFTPYDVVAYSTIAKELRKVAAQIEEEAKP